MKSIYYALSAQIAESKCTQGEVTTIHPFASSPTLLNDFQFNMAEMSGEFIFGYIGPIREMK